jgi:predicted porin
VVGGGATWSFDREGDANAVDERRDYNAYANVGFAGFTVGGALGIRENRGGDGSDDLVWGGGITYNWDAFTIGFGYTHGVYELGQPGGAFSAGPGTTITSLTSDVVDDSNVFSLTASYALGPGIQIDGVVEYYDYQGDEQIDRDYEGFAVGIGTLIGF